MGSSTELVVSDSKQMTAGVMQVGKEMPEFFCKTAHSDFWFHDFLSKDGAPAYTLLLSHPEDFSLEAGPNNHEITRRSVKMIGIVCDLGNADAHSTMDDDVHDVGYPVILDTTCFKLPDVESQKQVGMMLQQIAHSAHDPNTTLNNHRVAILIGPDKRILSVKSEPQACKRRTFEGLVCMIQEVLDSKSVRLPQKCGREWGCSSKCDATLAPKEQMIVFGAPLTATVMIALFILFI